MAKLKPKMARHVPLLTWKHLDPCCCFDGEDLTLHSSAADLQIQMFTLNFLRLMPLVFNCEVKKQESVANGFFFTVLCHC